MLKLNTFFTALTLATVAVATGCGKDEQPAQGGMPNGGGTTQSMVTTVTGATSVFKSMNLNLNEGDGFIVEFETFDTNALTSVDFKDSGSLPPHVMIEAEGQIASTVGTEMFDVQFVQENGIQRMLLRENNTGCTKQTCWYRVTVRLPVNTPYQMIESHHTPAHMHGDKSTLRPRARFHRRSSR